VTRSESSQQRVSGLVKGGKGERGSESSGLQGWPTWGGGDFLFTKVSKGEADFTLNPDHPKEK